MKKNMIRGLILFFTIGVFGCQTDNGWNVTVKGKVGFPQEGEIYIQEYKQDGSGKKETIELDKDYTFKKKLHLTEPGFYRLSFYDKQFVTVILDHSDLEINVDGNNANGFFEVKGSPDQELMVKVQEILGGVQNSPEMEQLQNELEGASSTQNMDRITELQDDYLKLINTGNDKVAKLLSEQPPSLAVIYLLEQNNFLDHDRYFDLYLSTAAKLNKEWPNYSATKDFNDIVNKLKVTAIGQMAPEIEMPNPEGKIVKLSSLRGKYVLVDFWAKWCGPCRQENPHVVMAYNKFKDKGFEVFGVSLDRNKEDWVKAISEDGLTWTHVSDLKYFESQAAKDYNIVGIPFSILLDPNGKIIAKNLRGKALDEKLEEVFGSI